MPDQNQNFPNQAVLDPKPSLKPKPKIDPKSEPKTKPDLNSNPDPSPPPPPPIQPTIEEDFPIDNKASVELPAIEEKSVTINDSQAIDDSQPFEPIDSTAIPHWEVTQEGVKALEDLFGFRIIVLYINLNSALTDMEVNEIYYHLQKIGHQENLGLLIYGPGGNGIAAYRIVKLVRSFTKKLTIIAPDIAASAMTMIALGGDEIVAGPLTALSPIDTSISNHPLAPKDKDKNPVTVEINEVKKYLELVKSEKYKEVDDFHKTPHHTLSEKVHPIFLGTVQRSLSLSKLLVRGIARTHISDASQIETIVNKLNDDYPTHGYPILAEDLKTLGLDVKELTKEQNQICIDLLSFYTYIADGGSNIKNDIRESWRTYSFIESQDFRSYDEFTSEEKRDGNEWIQMNSFSGYAHATIVKKENGLRKVDALTMDEFRKWMKGEEITIK